MVIGSAWKKESKDGKKYMSCVIQSPFIPGGEIHLAIFAVDEKKNDKAPDYNIVWSFPKKKNEQSSQDVAAQYAPDDEIPF